MVIKVGLYGMDTRCSERMLTVFKMVYKGQCVAVDIEDADTVIIDLDDKDSTSELQAFQSKYPAKPVVLMAENPVDIPGIPFVSKPAKLPDLLAALKETSNKDISTGLNMANQTDVKKTASSLQERLSSGEKQARRASVSSGNEFNIFYRPDKFLQGKVLKAINTAEKKKESVFVKCWSDRWIVISPSSDYLLENLKDKQLHNLGLVQVGEDVFYSEQKFSDDQIKEMANTPPNEVKSTLIEQFVWDITVRTARGRIPEGTSLDDLYVLHQWPNLTRLARIPNSMRISAFWLDQPQSINSVVEKLGIEMADVLTYFSAATAIGLLTPAKRREDKMVTPEVVVTEKKKKGILSAIMRKISKKASIDEDAA